MGYTDPSGSGKATRHIALTLAGLLTTWLGGVAIAGVPVVYHSPDDSGSGTETVMIPSDTTTTLNVYLDAGSTASGKGDPCCEGLGDEILGWDFRLEGRDGLTIVGVTPVGDVVANQTEAMVSFNGGDALNGTLGPTKLAEIEVSATADGALELIFGQVVGASLDVQDVAPTTIVTVPEPMPGLGQVIAILAVAFLFQQAARAR